MPALFSLPKQVPLSSAGALLPGAKLYFFQTGTTTPQNTYQDIALSTPHANPVVADASGVFAPIYLDASLPHYRVRLTTSADIQLWQVDGVPSNQNTAQSFTLTSTAPELIFNETDASANNKKWRIRATSEQLLIELLNDAESVATSIATFSRSGTSSPVVNFGTDFLQVNSETVPGVLSSTFTATLTGVSGSVTGSITGWRLAGTFTILSCDLAEITGTSNSTSMSITGVPSNFRPKPAAGARQCFVTAIDNGSIKGSLATISDSGVVSFGLGIDGTGAFTGSGSKGIPKGWTLFWF